MELNLKRPLVVFDLESTGLNITEDRIIELSYVKVYPDGHEESNTYRFNPEKVIPQQAIDVPTSPMRCSRASPPSSSAHMTLPECLRVATSPASTATILTFPCWPKR